MKGDLNNRFLSLIKEYLPESKDLTHHLIHRLGLSKEAAYRRSQGTVPFSIDEIIHLAGDFGFSVDEVIGHDLKHIPYSLDKNMLTEAEKRYMEIFRFFTKNFEQMFGSKHKQTLILTNQFSEFLNLRSEPMFRFFYYKYMHQANQITQGSPLSELQIPPQIVNAYQEYVLNHKEYSGHHNIVMIIDKNYFSAVMERVAYFYKRKLITPEEFTIIRDELLEYVEWSRTIAQRGKDPYGLKHSIFLSSLNIDSNFTHFEYDNSVCSLYWAYPINPIIVYDKKTCNLHKKWIESYKKYSSLISESNEMEQSNFFNFQYKSIEEIYNRNYGQ